jgi:spermidine synthase
MSERFTETLHFDYAQSFDVAKVLYDNNSSLQHVQVFDNDCFGRVLTLDGVVQTNHGDEFIYH